MEKPNVLFILADDLGWGDVGYHGSPIKTPNIDRLARSGVELDQHYVCPVCTPTRTSLMSGRHPGTFGKHATTPSNDPVLPDGYRTIATMFKEAGYATGLFGKWHLGSDPKFYPGAYGFDYSYGSLAGGVDPYTHRYKSGEHSYTWHLNQELIDEQGHATDLITQGAVEWIKQQTESWFCYVPYTAVHTPVKAPEQWKDRYEYIEFDVDPERNRSFKEYAAYTSHMDFCIGQLIETLKLTQQLDDTIVIFASDNGAVTTNPSKDTAKYPGRHDDMPRLGSNYPLRGHKGQMYEGGIRTPGILSWPGRLKPGKCKKPIHISDWLPTFAAMTGADADTEWDGEDVFSLITGASEVVRERPIYWNLQHNWFAVRSGDWKLILRNVDGIQSTELFNIGIDPLEHRECAKEYPEIVERLSQFIEEQHQLDDSAKRADVD